STAFESRVLAANRTPVAAPMPAETMFPLSELDRMLPLSDTALHTAAGSKRGRRSSRPSVSSRGTRTILTEPETRRLKNRGHLARNRKFESISLQERDGMGQAARKWHHRRCSQLMECPDAPAERLEQVPRRPGPRYHGHCRRR